MPKKGVTVTLAPRRKKKAQKKQPTAIGVGLRGLGALGGGALGSYLGAPMAGKAIGSSFGAALSRWLGYGDYKVSKNSLLSSSGSIPEMHKTNESVIIRHREFVREVKGSSSFATPFGLILQPGNHDAFPWLADIALRFQQYRWRGIVFHYVPTSGHALSSTNPAIGEVMMQTTYRSTDAAPSSKQEMLNEYWATESAPDKAFVHPIECDPKENPFSIHYVRSGDPPIGDTRMMYDLGQTWIATSGMPASGNVVGDLWVTYEVELFKPVVKSNSVAVTSYAYGKSTVPPQGTSFFPVGGIVGSGALPVTVSGSTFTFDVGNNIGIFSVNVAAYASAGFSAMAMTGTPTAVNCTLVPFNPYLSTNMYRGTVMTGTSPNLDFGTYCFHVQITEPFVTATVTMPNFNWTGASTYGTYEVTQLA